MFGGGRPENLGNTSLGLATIRATFGLMAGMAKDMIDD